jgi:hypothetical protein
MKGLLKKTANVHRNHGGAAELAKHPRTEPWDREREWSDDMKDI